MAKKQTRIFQNMSGKDKSVLVRTTQKNNRLVWLVVFVCVVGKQKKEISLNKEKPPKKRKWFTYYVFSLVVAVVRSLQKKN